VPGPTRLGQRKASCNLGILVYDRKVVVGTHNCQICYGRFSGYIWEAETRRPNSTDDSG
jgi:hypothetical protein